MDLTTFQSFVCFLIGAGTVCAIWVFFEILDRKDRE